MVIYILKVGYLSVAIQQLQETYWSAAVDLFKAVLLFLVDKSLHLLEPLVHLVLHLQVIHPWEL